MTSLEDLVRSSSRALILGVGGGGDVVGALATARFLEFCGLEFILGGLSWERNVYDPIPGPRKLSEVRNVDALHSFAWMANSRSQTDTGVYFAESRMAAALAKQVLLIDINGGVEGVVNGIETATKELQADLLVGIDVGGDSLAQGHEPGLRSPLADSIMLAAFAELAKRGRRTLWGVFGYGSDGELTVDEIEAALSKLAAADGLQGAWGCLPQRSPRKSRRLSKPCPPEPVPFLWECFRGAWGIRTIRGRKRTLKLTPLTTLTFFMAPEKLYESLSRPAQAVRESASLDKANNALHGLGIYTELDFERDHYKATKPQ